MVLSLSLSRCLILCFIKDTRLWRVRTRFLMGRVLSLRCQQALCSEHSSSNSSSSSSKRQEEEESQRSSDKRLPCSLLLRELAGACSARPHQGRRREESSEASRNHNQLERVSSGRQQARSCRAHSRARSREEACSVRRKRPQTPYLDHPRHSRCQPRHRRSRHTSPLSR